MVESSESDVILDCWIKTFDDWVARVKFLREVTKDRALSANALHKKYINALYFELGHSSESITYVTVKVMGIQVTSIFKLCKDCALGEAKQHEVSKKSVSWLKILGKTLFFDISSPSTPPFGGKKHWLLVVEDSGNCAWSFFLKKKSNLSGVMLGLIKNLRNKYSMKVQYLCCNNAGENVAFKKACKQEGLGEGFKYTAPDMPQQKGHVEWKFATLLNKVCTMLDGGKFNTFLCNGLGDTAANTTMLLKNNLSTQSRTSSPFQHFWGREREASVLDVKICWNVYCT